ncbi:hypothetical protein GCM10018965_084100 [Nonomuraea roseola]
MSQLLAGLGVAVGVIVMAAVPIGIAFFVMPPVFYVWEKWNTFWEKKGRRM